MKREQNSGRTAWKPSLHRPIRLFIGQELPQGREYEFIRRDLDRYADNPRLLFSYTGMHWRRQDRPVIRDIHRRLDDDWAERYAA